MKQFGSWSEVVNLVFRSDTRAITLRPHQATTYTASRDVQLPPGDAAHVLVSADSTQTLTNKSISGSTNTLSNISLAGSVTGVLPVANGGTNSNAALSNDRVMKSSAGTIIEAAAITAARALISDANGIPTHSATTATELGYVSGVTSAIQTQLDSRVADTGDTMTGDLVMDNQKGVRFREATGGGTNYVGLRAPAALAGDTLYDLPSAYPAVTGYLLSSTTAGVTSWIAPPSSSGSTTTDLQSADVTVSSGTTLSQPNLIIDTGFTYTINGSLAVIDTLTVNGTLTVSGRAYVA